MGSGVKGGSMVPIIACTARNTALHGVRTGFLAGAERPENCLTVPFPRGYTNPVQWNHPPTLPLNRPWHRHPPLSRKQW